LYRNRPRDRNFGDRRLAGRGSAGPARPRLSRAKPRGPLHRGGGSLGSAAGGRIGPSLRGSARQRRASGQAQDGDGRAGPPGRTGLPARRGLGADPAASEEQRRAGPGSDPRAGGPVGSRQLRRGRAQGHLRRSPPGRAGGGAHDQRAHRRRPGLRRAERGRRGAGGGLRLRRGHPGRHGPGDDGGHPRGQGQLRGRTAWRQGLRPGPGRPPGAEVPAGAPSGSGLGAGPRRAALGGRIGQDPTLPAPRGAGLLSQLRGRCGSAFGPGVRGHAPGVRRGHPPAAGAGPQVPAGLAREGRGPAPLGRPGAGWWGAPPTSRRFAPWWRR